MDVIKRIHEFERFGSVLGLERMEKLMQLLGNPEKGMNFIHVAGTNGKGSVCRFIYEVIKENGYKAGLYISPYIQLFNERIEFDGCLISDEDLKICGREVIERADNMTAQGYDSPTEFEIVTAIAFVFFKKKNADYVILEVGLGGRGDSTNIIEKPLASVITSISFDHMDKLGDTLALIAKEKAGIIKEGAPVVSNVFDEQAAKVIARAAYELNSALYDVTRLRPENVRKSLRAYGFDASIYGTAYNGIEISMVGEHQIQNALTALTALEIIRKSGAIKLGMQELLAGMKKARNIARFEIFGEGPYFVIDGAHNENGANVLKNAMKEHFAGKRALIVTGVLADKDVSGILSHFYEIADDFIATEPDNARKLPAAVLEEKIRAAGKNCEIAAGPVEAYYKAEEKSGGYDVVLFAGSLYLLGKIRSIVCERYKAV